jgi:cytoskeletal protein RodZ
MRPARGAPPDLVTVRRKKGISLKEIAQTTKIGVFYLQAIENGEFSKLPGGIYSTSYIRQYAQAIDYNESELLEHYYRAMGIAPEPETTEQRPSRHSKKSFSEFLRPVTRMLS